MKINRGPEMAMLRFVVLPAIKEVKSFLKDSRVEDAQKTVMKDILGLLIPYMDSEDEKYADTPESLKEAPQKKRMKDNAGQYREAVANLYDMETNTLRLVGEWDLDLVERIVNEILNS